MKAKDKLPVVLVPACNGMLGHHPFQIAGKKYIDSVRLAGCLPLVVPNAPGLTKSTRCSHWPTACC